MSRHVPEFALVTGGALALSVLGAGLVLTGDVARTVLSAVLVGYPFAGYAVHHSEDPTDVLPPRLVLSVGVTAALTVLVAAVVGPLSLLPRRLLYALFVALAVGLPPAAYAVRYGNLRPTPPQATAIGATVVALVLLVTGPAVGDAVLGATDALLVFLAGSVYAAACGVAGSRRTRRALVVAGAVVGVLLAGFGVVSATSDSVSWVLAGIAAILGPTLYYALTVELLDGPRSRRRRGRGQ